jgi:hypothetical protein
MINGKKKYVIYMVVIFSNKSLMFTYVYRKVAGNRHIIQLRKMSL